MEAGRKGSGNLPVTPRGDRSCAPHCPQTAYEDSPVSTLKPSALLTVPKELVVLEQPQLALKNVVLSPHVEEEISGLIAETLRSEELAAFDLQPRHRVLLHGEPGNGKTMLAEALASELELPFLRAKYSGLVDSYMGGTGKNIDKLFEYAATAPCVLFWTSSMVWRSRVMGLEM